MALNRIQTTTGTASPAELGRTLVHEHVLVGFPGWELDAKAPKFKRAEGMARAVDQMHELKGHGVQTFVDPCPLDLGRDAEFLAELSQQSGMRVICTTGAYFEAEGNTFTFRQLSVEQITEIYIKEIEEGIGETGIKAGAIKIATGAPTASAYERKLVTAGARAARRQASRSFLTRRMAAVDTTRLISSPAKDCQRANCWWGIPTVTPTLSITARWRRAARMSASIGLASRSFNLMRSASPIF